jgi:hypothetical protein
MCPMLFFPNVVSELYGFLDSVEAGYFHVLVSNPRIRINTELCHVVR